MTQTSQRNQDLVRMRALGVSRRELADRFGVTRGRIALIEQKAAARQAQARRRDRLQAEMRALDDLDKPWPVADLLDAFHLPVFSRNRLLSHFGDTQRAELTLGEWMNPPVPAAAEPPDQPWPPLLRVRGIGKYGYDSVVAELTAADLGPRCNAAWRERLAELRRQEWLLADTERRE